MGEADLSGFPLTFNGRLKIEARPERLSADTGSLILREVDERLGWTDWIAKNLHDRRKPEWIIHPLVELLRTRIYMIAQGWNDQDDADHLRNDPALRVAVSTRRGDEPLRTAEEYGEEKVVPEGLASQPTMSRLIEALATEHNMRVLREGLPLAVGSALKSRREHRLQNATMDVDSFPIEVFGYQAGSKYNGYYHRRMFNPIVAMVSETEDFIGAMLREGTAGTAEGIEEFVLPLVDWMEREICVVASVRGDAGMPSDPILSRLEARKTGYCFRLRNNAVLDALAEPYLVRPPGRRPKEERTFFQELTYKAEPWTRERRVVLVMMDRAGELFLHHFFLLTDWSEEQMPAEDLLAFYRRRGSHEGHLGEFMNALKVALSCSSRPKSTYAGERLERDWPGRSAEEEFFCNEVTLLMYVWSYNLANQVRHLVEGALPQDRGPSAKLNPGGWSIKRVQQKILRVPARFMLHARSVVAALSQEVAALWNAIAPHLAGLPRAAFPVGLEFCEAPHG
jgi:hypothetical protein